MERIKQELSSIGYDGSIGKMSITCVNIVKEYAVITFLKKGNAKLIENLIRLGWEKHSEYKTFGSPSYKGYSLTVECRKLIK